MNNLILFLNTFFSYILLMVIIGVVMAIAIVIGIKWRKAKDAKAALLATQTPQDTEVKNE